jgi:hypothetical protein
MDDIGAVCGINSVVQQCTNFFSRNMRERDYLYSGRLRGEERTGLIWLRIRISGGLLYTQ